MAVAPATVALAAIPEASTPDAVPVPAGQTAHVPEAPDRLEWPMGVPRTASRALAFGALIWFFKRRTEIR